MLCPQEKIQKSLLTYANKLTGTGTLKKHLLYLVYPCLLSGILAAMDVFSTSVLVGIFYLIGFGLFCLESLLSLWVLQQVYMYFRGARK